MNDLGRYIPTAAANVPACQSDQLKHLRNPDCHSDCASDIHSPLPKPVAMPESLKSFLLCPFIMDPRGLLLLTQGGNEEIGSHHACITHSYTLKYPRRLHLFILRSANSAISPLPRCRTPGAIQSNATPVSRDLNSHVSRSQR